jgi:nitrite reductase/ring-hydroxylating ferredoxin subunit
MSTRKSGDVIPLGNLPPCKRGVSRRKFCATAGAAGLVALGLPGCDGGMERVSTGMIDDTNPGGGGGGVGPTPDMGDDLAHHGSGSHDLGGGGGGGDDLASGGGSHDLSGGGGTCAPMPLDAGPESAIAMGTAKHLTDNFNYDLFVCRDAGGLYALDASCTHSGCTVQKQATRFYCPCHGAHFDLNGQNPAAPAYSPLKHYALCVDGSGNIKVDYNTNVPASTRA